MSTAFNNRWLALGRFGSRLAAVAAVLACAVGAYAGGPVGGRVVGTLSRVDAGQARLILSRDSQIGSRYGQSGPINVYYDANARVGELVRGDRLLVEVRKEGARLRAGRIERLATTTQDHEWGSYLHGTVHEIRTRTRTIHVDEIDTRIFNRIGYDDQTSVENLGGAPLSVADLNGREVDIALRRNQRVPVAAKIVVLDAAPQP